MLLQIKYVMMVIVSLTVIHLCFLDLPANSTTAVAPSLHTKDNLKGVRGSFISC